MKHIGVLGDGITARAVRRFLNQSKEYELVAVSVADTIIASPGIPPHEWPNGAGDIISDIEFAYRILKCEDRLPTIVGVTGTNGKTTVASGLAHALSTEAYGNIGRPLIDQMEHLNSKDVIIVELSSFQLFSSPTLVCDIAIIINIEPDHLLWHGSFENYKNAKLGIVRGPHQQVVCPEGLTVQISGHRTNIESLPMPHWPQFFGRHNFLNAGIIQHVALTLGVNQDELNRRMSAYQLPPFRCQVIQNRLGQLVVNDSKATNMSSTRAAVQGFHGEKLLILCGQPKENYTVEFMDEIFSHCRWVFAAGGLAKYTSVFPVEYHSKLRFFHTLKAATAEALLLVGRGTILLSPSAASFDEFNNYMHRGEEFNQYVSGCY
jgi:UDP-N-acetylmuramoylalanine--D-glutamate ligase